METIAELLAHAPALRSLSGAHRELIAGCAVNRVFEPGELLLRDGDPANAFFVLRRGTVALETFAPQRGAVTIETIHDGDLLGWSWLVPPYRTSFDARAVTTVHVIAFDAACLRGKFDADPALGYELFQVFTGVIVERLQSTRMRLLDVYGKVPGEPVPGG
jgi:CRP/FNR family transcriptional regulator, cyclic AMP receptor protein